MPYVSNACEVGFDFALIFDQLQTPKLRKRIHALAFDLAADAYSSVEG
jgi:hypothetical protein